MLSYCVQGFSYPVAAMDAAERGWFINRLRRQQEIERRMLKSK